MRTLLFLALSVVLSAPFSAGAQVRCAEPAWTSIHPLAQNSKAAQFQKALSLNKKRLLALYPGVSEHEYESLSRLAFAIMGTESKYYQSWRYFLKSWAPASAVKVAKCKLRGQCGEKFLLSSGPTQIKEIPTRIQLEFKVTPTSLFSNPEHAAIATMGFLFELREYLEELQKDRFQITLDHLTDANMNDHLVYFYQGKGRRILMGEKPDPKKNGYLAAIHEHMGAIRVATPECQEPILIARPNPLPSSQPNRPAQPVLEGNAPEAMQ